MGEPISLEEGVALGGFGDVEGEDSLRLPGGGDEVLGEMEGGWVVAGGVLTVEQCFAAAILAAGDDGFVGDDETLLGRGIFAGAGAA